MSQHRKRLDSGPTDCSSCPLTFDQVACRSTWNDWTAGPLTARVAHWLLPIIPLSHHECTPPSHLFQWSCAQIIQPVLVIVLIPDGPRKRQPIICSRATPLLLRIAVGAKLRFLCLRKSPGVYIQYVSSHLLSVSVTAMASSSSEIAELQYERNHIDDTHVPQMIVAFVVSLFLAYSAILLRLISRRLSRTQLGWDDRIIVLSLVSSLSVDHHYSL